MGDRLGIPGAVGFLPLPWTGVEAQPQQNAGVPAQLGTGVGQPRMHGHGV